MDGSNICLRGLKRILRRPATLMSFAIAITATLTTADGYLALFTGALALLVVVLPLVWKGRVGRWPAQGISKTRRCPRDIAGEAIDGQAEALMKWDHAALLGISTAGVVLMVLFGFGKHVFFRLRPELSHTEGWEMGALVWTGLTWLFYWFKVETPYPQVERMTLLLFGLAGGIFGYMALTALHQPLWHVLWVTLISLVLLVLDVLLTLCNKTPRARFHFKISAVVADLPIVLGLVVLILYALAFPDAEHPEVFLSGAISLQFVVSNVVFVVCWSGLLDQQGLFSPGTSGNSVAGDPDGPLCAVPVPRGGEQPAQAGNPG